MPVVDVLLIGRKLEGNDLGIIEIHPQHRCRRTWENCNTLHTYKPLLLSKFKLGLSQTQV
jgi:hypothetical protein